MGGRAEPVLPETEAAFTFVCPIWKKPWMWCGGDTYVSNLIESAGGTNLLARPRTLSDARARRCARAGTRTWSFFPTSRTPFTAEDATLFRHVVGRFQDISSRGTEREPSEDWSSCAHASHHRRPSSP